MIWLVLVLALLGGCTREAPFRDVVAGDPLPVFSLEMSDGTVLSPGELARGTVVIVFFNTSCPDCVRELPYVQKAWEERGDARIIPVSREEDAQSVERFWTANGLTMPYSAQGDRRIYGLFARTGIPRTYTAVDGTVISVLGP